MVGRLVTRERRVWRILSCMSTPCEMQSFIVWMMADCREIHSASVVHHNDVSSDGENLIPTFAIPAQSLHARPQSTPTVITSNASSLCAPSPSSTRRMSAGLAAPDDRDPLSCATTLSSETPDTRSGPSVGIQSRSSSGVARLLDGDPDSGTKSDAVPSETAEPVELGARSVLFPTTTRQYASISSSLRSLHAQNSDHQRSRACSVTGRSTPKLRI
jgi:hypothetical protein